MIQIQCSIVFLVHPIFLNVFESHYNILSGLCFPVHADHSYRQSEAGDEEEVAGCLLATVIMTIDELPEDDHQ